MPTIHLVTTIQSPVEICFDLARNIDVHQQSTSKTKEKAIAGRISGLCEAGDLITWRAKHFGIWQNLTVKVTDMKRPSYFEDAMIKGAFKSMKHRHFFEQQEKVTVMKDEFDYQSPMGILGEIADRLFLKKYMTKFLKERNSVLKFLAERSQNFN